DRDGRGLLLAGLSGAGKSTLSVALARCGFSLISDDWTYISRNLAMHDTDTGTIGADASLLIAHGLLAPVKLLPDVVRHFPELSSHTPKMWFNGELAFELKAEDICRGSQKSESSPRWLFFLERDSTPGCSFHAVSATDARHFFESSAERLPDQ